MTTRRYAPAALLALALPLSSGPAWALQDDPPEDDSSPENPYGIDPQVADELLGLLSNGVNIPDPWVLVESTETKGKDKDADQCVDPWNVVTGTSAATVQSNGPDLDGAGAAATTGPSCQVASTAAAEGTLFEKWVFDPPVQGFVGEAAFFGLLEVDTKAMLIHAHAAAMAYGYVEVSTSLGQGAACEAYIGVRTTQYHPIPIGIPSPVSGGIPNHHVKDVAAGGMAMWGDHDSDLVYIPDQEVSSVTVTSRSGGYVEAMAQSGAQDKFGGSAASAVVVGDVIAAPILTVKPK